MKLRMVRNLLLSIVSSGILDRHNIAVTPVMPCRRRHYGICSAASQPGIDPWLSGASCRGATAANRKLISICVALKSLNCA